MVIDDFKLFKEFEEKCGNKYLAVKFIASAARNLGKDKKEYHLSESKLIQWILTGVCPYDTSQLESMRRANNDDGLDDILCWIMDKDISDKVRELYAKSVKQKHLITYANPKLSQSKIDRINILLRMIWYSKI